MEPARAALVAAGIFHVVFAAAFFGLFPLGAILPAAALLAR